MTRWEKWTLHVLTMVVTATGIGFFVMKYLMESQDPFAVINHPLQPWLLSLHILTAAPFVLVGGIVFRSHVAGKLGRRGGPNRRSGWLAFLSFPVMVLSGYLLQVVADPVIARATLVVHLSSSGTFAIGFAAHQVVTLKLARDQRSRSRGTVRAEAAV